MRLRWSDDSEADVFMDELDGDSSAEEAQVKFLTVVLDLVDVVEDNTLNTTGKR